MVTAANPKRRYDPVALPHAARHIGRRHMAASGHYLATQAAFSVLEAGGNAVDAGVAGGLALGVVQTEYVHIAGVAPIMIYLAETDEVVTISGLGWWPRLASAAYFRENHGGRIPMGIKRAVVPGAPDAWLTALERYGTMSFGEVATAAHRFASEGFAVSTLMHEIISDSVEILGRWSENARIYLPDGKPLEPGSVCRLPDLAGSIAYMMDEEAAFAGQGREEGIDAARRAFYRGDIAREIDRYHRENDGWLRMEDLAEFRAGIEPPVSVRFGDIDVFTCGPWCQGPVLAQTLNLLDADILASMRHNSPDYLHYIVEALKLAFADRHAFYGDPRFVDVPIEKLLGSDYAETRRKLIDSYRAAPGMPEPGDAPRPKEWIEPDLDTSYVCVVDERGNAFSATPSDGCLNGPVIPGLGLNPSARGGQSWTDPAHPSCLAPGKRPRLTPSPAFARRADEWRMPFGTPGEDVQPQAMLQTFLNVVGFGMPIGEAILQPRLATYSFPGSSDPHNYFPGRLNLEGRIAPATAEELRARGHDVVAWPDWEWRAGSVCAISVDVIGGTMEGAADPRRTGSVAGV